MHRLAPQPWISTTHLFGLMIQWHEAYIVGLSPDSAWMVARDFWGAAGASGLSERVTF